MINYEIDENGIFTVKFKGDISFDEILAFIQILKDFNELKNQLKVLYDLSDAELELSQEQVRQISEKGIEATSRFERVMAAFVVSEPKETAYSIIFSLLNSSPHTIRDVFSTRSAAISWLLGIR
jgi:hypothetical protein